MKIVSYTGLFVGLAVIAVLVAWQGFGNVGAILMTLGWGIVLLPFLWLPQLSLNGASWRMLFTPGRAPGLAGSVIGMWVGYSVATLLPTASIGDEVVKARMLIHRGIRGVDASASVVLDKTVQAVSLLLWGLIGIVALVWMAASEKFVIAALVGSALLAAGIGGFIAVQHAGAFGFFAKFFARLRPSGDHRELVNDAGEVDAVIRALYRNPGRFALSCGVRLAGRIVMTAEILVAAYLMGHPLTLVDAVMLRSLSMALRGAAFVVPNGLGVQEGSFIVLGALVGLSPEVMLALSLASRARELIVSVPGVLVWQHAEGRALWRRRNARERAD